jgi:hypothetical protein
MQEVVETCTTLVPNSLDLESSKLLHIYTAWRQRNRVGGYLKDHLPFYALFEKITRAENASLEFNFLFHVQFIVKTSIS